MSGHRGQFEINPGSYGFSVDEFAGHEHIGQHSRLTLHIPPELITTNNRIRIEQGQKITYTQMEDYSKKAGDTHYMCVSHYLEGDLEADGTSFHPFSDAVYKIKRKNSDGDKEVLGYLNVSSPRPGWYAMEQDSPLPLCFEDDEKLIYKHVRDAFTDPQDFLDYVEGEGIENPLTYNVRVTEPDLY